MYCFDTYERITLQLHFGWPNKVPHPPIIWNQTPVSVSHTKSSIIFLTQKRVYGKHENKHNCITTRKLVLNH